MADACLMLTYITISTVARFKIIFASWSRTDYVQKGSHRRNGNGDACSLVTHLANSITGRLYEYHRVVTAFRLHSVRNLKIQTPHAPAMESSLSMKFVHSCFHFLVASSLLNNSAIHLLTSVLYFSLQDLCVILWSVFRMALAPTSLWVPIHL